MKTDLIKALSLGALAGMRSMAAPALLSHFMSQNGVNPLQRTPLRLLGNSTVAKVLTGLAITEVAGDKYPKAPNRIEIPGLLTRGASGALVGAAVYLMQRKKALKGAAVGAAAAVAATYGSFYLRKYLGEHTPIPDPIYGALEDALVLGSGLKAAQL